MANKIHKEMRKVVRYARENPGQFCGGAFVYALDLQDKELEDYPDWVFAAVVKAVAAEFQEYIK